MSSKKGDGEPRESKRKFRFFKDIAIQKTPGRYWLFLSLTMLGPFHEGWQTPTPGKALLQALTEPLPTAGIPPFFLQSEGASVKI